MTKIIVPEGMLKAAMDCHEYTPDVRVIRKELEVALEWLAENPIAPSGKNKILALREIAQRVDQSYGSYSSTAAAIVAVICEWQRQMFLAPDLEEPEAIKDLMLPDIESGFFKPEILNERLIEAYNRGRKKHGEPEESAYRRATMAIGAVTLSREEGERIIEYVRGAIHG